MIRTASLFCFLLIGSFAHCQEEAWVDLFDGVSLDGWTQRGGEAEYTIGSDTDGGPMIVGTAVANTPNSFLCTDKDYADFVLEFEVKVDPPLNSGVQFRSLCHENDVEITYQEGDEERSKRIPAGRVHGYQAEIDPTDRAFSGGVYDEARRGWIYRPEGPDHVEARAAFDIGGWNNYRIEAVGDQIRTFVNGVPVADFIDEMTAEGFIALQVHSIRNESEVGKQIRWRNVRISER